jgi:transcriptional regulator with XRE-family HTH domain
MNMRMRIMREMSTIAHIRTRVFGIQSQRAFAEAIGTSQPTVWRWENGASPSTQGLEKIRSAALERGLPWDDRWFFEEPA